MKKLFSDFSILTIATVTMFLWDNVNYKDHHDSLMLYLFVLLSVGFITIGSYSIDTRDEKSEYLFGTVFSTALPFLIGTIVYCLTLPFQKSFALFYSGVTTLALSVLYLFLYYKIQKK